MNFVKEMTKDNVALRDCANMLFLKKGKSNEMANHVKNVPIKFIIDDEQNVYNYTSHSAIENTIDSLIQANSSYTDNEVIPFQINVQNILAMFNYISQGIIISSSSGTIVYCNDEALSFLNTTRTHLINRVHSEIFNHMIISNHEMLSYYYKFYKKMPIKMSNVYVNHQNEEKYYTFTTTYDLILNSYITIITDETEQHKLKLEKEKQQNLKALGEYSTMIIHEVRNPLSSIKGFFQLVKEHVKTDYKHYIDVIDSELIRIEHLVEDILYYSRSSSDKFELISIPTLIEEVLNIMRIEAGSRKVTLKFFKVNKNNYYTMGNKYRLTQVLMNLIRNAMDVSEDSEIILHLMPIDDNSFELRIKDFGEGMSEEVLENIMQPFFTTKSNGTGLGLSIVKNILDNHQIKLNIKSLINKGTCFILTCKNAIY